MAYSFYFFIFMLLHQTDKLLVNPLAAQIYDEWNLTDTQWGAISTATLIVGAVFYPFMDFSLIIIGIING